MSNILGLILTSLLYLVIVAFAIDEGQRGCEVSEYYVCLYITQLLPHYVPIIFLTLINTSLLLSQIVYDYDRVALVLN